MLASLLALVCCGYTSGASAALLAGELAHAIAGEDHSHQAVLVVDAGHLHLALSHGADAAVDAAGSLLAAPRPPQRDHVLAATSGELRTTDSRRVDPARTTALAIPAFLGLPAPPRPNARPVCARTGRGTASEEGVVLRL